MASEKEGALAHGTVAHLLPQTYKHLISSWLEEDAPSFDYGGFVVGEEMAEARLLGKEQTTTPVLCRVKSDSRSKSGSAGAVKNRACRAQTTPLCNPPCRGALVVQA